MSWLLTTIAEAPLLFKLRQQAWSLFCCKIDPDQRTYRIGSNSMNMFASYGTQ
jgi:hypothetical protein